MTGAVAILATGTRFDEYRLPGEDDEPRWARAAAGDLVFVRSTAFVEFDAGAGAERWDETPQGPFPVPLRESATTALLQIVEDDPTSLNPLADLGIAGMRPSRFDWHAAPRRIEIAPELAEQLILD